MGERPGTWDILWLEMEYTWYSLRILIQLFSVLAACGMAKFLAELYIQPFQILYNQFVDFRCLPVVAGYAFIHKRQASWNGLVVLAPDFYRRPP